MSCWLTEARRRFHAECLAGPITETRGVPSIADVSNSVSREIASALVTRIGATQSHAAKPAGQTAGSMFETATQNFIAACFEKLSHLRPGEFSVAKGQTIAQFDQYSHLDELRALAMQNRELRTLLGSDYLIKPDVVVLRQPVSDAALNRDLALIDNSVARYTALRQKNGARASLHASISCKLTIRSDRVQNTRSEALIWSATARAACPILSPSRQSRCPHASRPSRLAPAIWIASITSRCRNCWTVCKIRDASGLTLWKP